MQTELERAQTIRAERRRVLDIRKARRRAAKGTIPFDSQALTDAVAASAEQAMGLAAPAATGARKYQGLQPSRGASRKHRRRTIRSQMALDAAPTRYWFEGRKGAAWSAVLAHQSEKVASLTKALGDKGIRDLKKAAAKVRVHGYGKMTKARLVSAIVKARFPHPATA